MTKDELHEKILENFHDKYLTSDLSDFLLNMDVMGLVSNMSINEMEEHIASLFDDLADDAMDTLEETGVMKTKKQNTV